MLSTRARIIAAAMLFCAAGYGGVSGQASAAEPVEIPSDRERARDLEELETADVTALAPEDVMDERHVGTRVRWAGAIHSIGRSSRGACLTIIFARSGEYGEPRWMPDPTYQTFVACGTGDYDADLVHDYTNVTIIGTVTGKQYIGMGGGGSDGPVIEIERLYRWSDCLMGDASPICRQGFLTAQPVTGD